MDGCAGGYGAAGADARGDGARAADPTLAWSAARTQVYAHAVDPAMSRADMHRAMTGWGMME